MTGVYHKPKACPACACTQDLPDELQSCPCRCHPANWPPEAAPLLLEACRAFVAAWERSLQLEKTDVALRLAKRGIEAVDQA